MGSPLIFLAKQAVTLCIVEISGKRMMGGEVRMKEIVAGE